MSLRAQIPVAELSSLLDAAQRNGVETIDVHLDGRALMLSVADGNEHYGQTVTVTLTQQSTEGDTP